jgi:arylsulfatase A-like enzyme
MKLASAVHKATNLPNILLIVMDAVRAKNLSCYGYYRPTSPNLERFARRCVIYDTAISPGGWSLPAHASIFTGLYPSRHGAHEQYKHLRAEFPTMAELLCARGYRTLAFCYNAYVSPATGLARGFGSFNQPFDRIPHPIRRLAGKAESGLALLRGMRDSGARYINRQVRAALSRLQGDKQPFFLFVHYGEPHAPYRPPRRYNRYLPRDISLKRAGQVNQDQWAYLARQVSMDKEDFEILTALYDAEITYLDSRIAEVLNWLETWDILDQTMVIVTADHGENIGEHGLMGHQYCLYDTLLHVPLLVHYPKGVTAPGRVSHQVQTLDLLPTVLAMLGDTSSEAYCSLQGYDLLSSTRHDFAVAEWARPNLDRFHRRYPGIDVSIYDRSIKMVRTNHLKYIWSSDGAHELYNLQNDPGETHNIQAECPTLAQNLDRLLTTWRTSFEVANLPDKAPEFDQEVRNRLRALGYLE